MKKFIYLVGLAAIVLAGCSNEEDVATNSNSAEPISFGTFVQKMTKSGNTDFPVGKDFLVLGYNTGSADYDATTPLNYMRQVVTKTNATTYSYFPVKYWPNNLDKISFFAISPSDGVTVLPAFGESGVPAATYIAPGDVKKHKDVMYAVNTDKTSGPINFSFSHCLAKVGFSAKMASDYSSDGTCIRINNITLNNVASILNFTTNVDGTINIGTPENTAKASTFSLHYLNDNFVNNGAVTSVTSANIMMDDSYLMLPPCDYSSGTAITATVSYTVTTADGITTLQTKTASLNPNLQAGKAYTYVLTVSLTSVVFSAAQQSDWTPETPTDITL